MTDGSVPGPTRAAQPSTRATSELPVRRVRPQDVDRLRDARLAALRETPEAFVSRYADEALKPPEFWLERAAQNATGDRVATFVIEHDGVFIGTVTGLRLAASEPAELVGMWVAPDARRNGLGRRLVEAACAWAAATGAERIEVSVHLPNKPAQTLYERAGFTAVRPPFPRHDGRAGLELRLARPLTGDERAGA